MIKELSWYVAGKTYTFSVETAEKNGETLISATEMRRVNKLISSEILENDKLLTLDQYKFLKDVTGTTVKEIIKYNESERKEFFKSKLSEI